MSHAWTIYLLGGLRIESSEAEHSRFRSHKTAALLAFLAYYLDRPHPREVLIELIWPESTLEAARNSLSASLSSLRRQLEPPGTPTGCVLRANRESVSLNSEVIRVDAREFERCLRRAYRAREGDEERGLLESALEWYGGPLLPGFYEEWVLPESQRLADLFSAAALRLAALLEGQGAFTHALDLTLRAASLAPLDERVHQLCLRLLIHERDLSGAIRLYQEFERRLREEIGAIPSPELRALLEHPASQMAAGAASLAVPSTQASRVSAVPAPRPASAPIPPRFDRFFGRDREFAVLNAWLETPTEHNGRLATLQGPGGSGKTRLAAEWARARSGSFNQRIWFVTLTEESDGTRVLPAICEALRLPPKPGARPQDQLIAFLGEGPALMVLDNLEQLGEGAASPILALLGSIPALKILTTSRVRLALPGERLIELPPLPLPDEVADPEEAYASPAVRLFVDRAQAVAPDFQLTPRTARAVISVCRRLEGVPLALELAASWAGTLSVAQLEERVAERLDLEARRSSGIERRSSLRATLEWSFGLLPEEARRFLARLSVFRGGWSVEAAAVVGGVATPLPLLSQLRAHSFLSLDGMTDRPRYRILETIREFAAEQLSFEEGEAARLAHSEAFGDLATEASQGWHSHAEPEWLDRLDVDSDNLRAALAYLIEPVEERRAPAANLCRNLSRWWRVRGGAEEGLAAVDSLLTNAGASKRAALLIERCLLLDALGRYAEMVAPANEALDASENDSFEAAQALFCLAEADEAAGRYVEGIERLERALTILRPIEAAPQIATCLNLLGLHHKNRRELEEAEGAFAECLAIWERLGERRGAAQVCGNLGLMAEDRGDFDEARRRAEEALGHFEAVGDRLGQARALNNLGNDALRREDPERARRCFEKSLLLRRQIGDRFGTSYALFGLGCLAAEREDLNTAHSCLYECLEIFGAAEDPYGVAAVLHELARLQESGRSISNALTLLLAARSLRLKAGAPYTEREENTLGERERLLCARLSAARREAAENRAREMSLPEAVHWTRSLRESPLRKHDAP